ncbi:hypothetical protein [Knoellia sp. LjRoot47]|uniref:hypothetical protein n=1 Tax=Knoellia sp. LjRoot47 TaxID=3342330 RepID=UPI003ED0167D
MTDPRIVPTGVPAVGPTTSADHETPDPLRLCIFATVALLGWLLGPFALVFFAGLGVLGYARARRAGLLRSKCLLGDTRIVLGYLALLVVVAVAALVVGFGPWRLW